MYFCQLIDAGRNASFSFVVITLAGPSLSDLRKASPSYKFSLGTALSMGIKCLEALELVHRVGYLHRDIKPANYATGPPPNQLRRVFILDFGLSRRHLKGANEVRSRRSAAGFRGTIRYGPINCHLAKELGRKDDCEAWFYQQASSRLYLNLTRYVSSRKEYHGSFSGPNLAPFCHRRQQTSCSSCDWSVDRREIC